eukprot:2492340-Pleurochrysis_carterae.AAC.1
MASVLLPRQRKSASRRRVDSRDHTEASIFMRVGVHACKWPQIVALAQTTASVSYTHLRAHETDSYL